MVGSEDPVTDYYAERYAEWQFLTDTVGLVVLDQAGHLFLKYRADELAEIVTATHPALAAGDTAALEPAARGADAAWALRDAQRLGVAADPTARSVKPSMGRFLAVSAGQLVSTTGSALTSFALGNVFLAPALVLTTPLVLSFGTVAQVAQVAVAEALGAIAGGTLMALWGGPRQRRMIGVLVGNLGTAVGCALVGLRPSIIVVTVGLFLMTMAMATAQDIYATIVQVKVPQRYHGRVFALNQTISWSTLPIGFALLAPLGTALFEPLLAPGEALAGSVGTVIGVGPGRGIGLAYLVFGVMLAVVTGGGFLIKALRRFDTEVPDSLPDDLIGAQERARRLAAAQAGDRKPVAAAA